MPDITINGQLNRTVVTNKKKRKTGGVLKSMLTLNEAIIDVKEG